MKKTVSIILGLGLIAGSVIPFTFASRDAYHVYLTSQKNLRRFRYFTDRLGELSRLTQSRSYATNENTTKKVKNLRFPSGSKRYLYARKEKTNSALSVRPTTQQAISLWQNELRQSVSSKKVSIKNNVVFETYENEAFSLQLPKGWFDQSEVTHEFNSPENDYKVSIKKFEKDVCKEITGFTACVIALSKNENREALEGQGKILTTSRIIRKTRNSDTVLNEVNVQTATYTESFTAQFGFEEKYISRYFVRDLDGGIYFIETQTTPQKASSYVSITKQIFDSFRIYSQ